MKKILMIGLFVFVPYTTHAIQFNFLGLIFGNKNIHNYGTYRAYKDGNFAKTCNEYKNPINNYSYKGSTGNGIYRIKPDSNPAFDVYCDMTGGVWDNFAGGYTLVGLFNSTSQPTPISKESMDGTTLGFLSNSKYTTLLGLSSHIYHMANTTIVVKTPKTNLPSLNCYKNDTTANPENLGGTFIWFHSENSGCNASGGDHSEVYFGSSAAIVFSSAGGFSSYWVSGTTFQTDGAGYDIRKTFTTYSGTDLTYMYVK